ncbi:MAG: phage portal protein [Clostridia bacterium]|nr:phage portal protein [Clostridia bacterium]
MTNYRSREMNTDTVKRYLKQHKRELRRYKILEEAYLNKRRVDKGRVADGRANNQVKSDWAGYIADMVTDYTIGIATKYGITHDRSDDIVAALENSNEDIVNFELIDDMNIYGVGYEYHYLDERGEFNFINVSPYNAFVVYDTKLKKSPIGAVYYETITVDGVEVTKGEWFDSAFAHPFELGVGETVKEGEPYEHKINGVPIIEVKANKRGLSSYEKVISLLDAYNYTLSNNTDDLQSTANAYLHIDGANDVRQEDIDRINKTRVIGFNGKVEYITKNLPADVLETHKKSLKTDLLTIAKVPDLSDENFAGDLSGVAIKFKLWSLEQIRSGLVRYFTVLLNKRFQRIIECLTLKEIPLSEVTKSIDITFTKNMPTNDYETVQMASLLYGKISQRAFLAMLPDYIVADVDKEIELEDNEIGEGDSYDLSAILEKRQDDVDDEE